MSGKLCVIGQMLFGGMLLIVLHFASHPHPDLLNPFCLSFIVNLTPLFFLVRFLGYRLVFFCLTATQIPPPYSFSYGTKVTRDEHGEDATTRTAAIATVALAAQTIPVD